MSTVSVPNMAECYRESYDFLFQQLPESMKRKVLAEVNNDKEPSPEVQAFIKRVIAFAEGGF